MIRNRVPSAAASLLVFSGGQHPGESYPSSIANHTDILRAMVAYLFRERHPGKPGRPLHSGSRHDKAGYDGYDTR
ncbi:hypothetical protein, partial [Paenibacillus prosopidis]